MCFFRPIISPADEKDRESKSHDEDIDLIVQYFKLDQTFEESYGLRTDEANALLGQNRENDLIDIIISKYKALEGKYDFVVCESSDYLSKGTAVEFNLNQEIAKNLGCPIIVLGSAHDRTVEETVQSIQISVDAYRAYEADIVGIVINKANPEQVIALRRELNNRYRESDYSLIVIPNDPRLSCPRLSDIVKHLKGQVLCGHNHLNAIVRRCIVCAMQLQNALKWLTEDDSLLVTSGDRGDIIVGALQAHRSSNYPRLSGIILTGGVLPDASILRLVNGLPESLPLISVQPGTFETASAVNEVHASLSPSDQEKIGLSINAFEAHVDNMERFEQKILPENCIDCVPKSQAKIMTPKMFMYNLVTQARIQKQHIVLPEGTDMRILKAAGILAQRGIVNLTLLGKQNEISDVINQNGIAVDLDRVNVLDPLNSGGLLEKYSNIFYELRKHKGTVPNVDAARDEVMDSTCFATMMVYCGDANGMVSGARHTTQHTIRPALQIIKTKPGFRIVSSVFLMCLDHHVLVYGDCAVNPNPTAEQLADIAIASADTAKTFGIHPKVAMLSYSSGDSGKGSEVEKVREATKIARERRSDLPIEGPIQYDAAVDKAVAAQKMPNSTVAGQATVFVFPDLNTGNNTYKAVQRETGAIAIGPILQGESYYYY